MDLANDLYREIILDHYKSPRHHGELPTPPALKVDGANPLCGDQISLYLDIENGTIKDLRFSGKGCAISQASCSLLTEALVGKPVDYARSLAETFKHKMLGGNAPQTPVELGDLESLEGVKKYPARVKCGVLAWNTLLEGLKQSEETKLAQRHTSEVPEGWLISEKDVLHVLKAVEDPELHISVVDLGLIYRVEFEPPGKIRIKMTLTSPGCPVGPQLRAQVHAAARTLPGVNDVAVELVWMPPWDPKTMASEDAKNELGIW